MQHVHRLPAALAAISLLSCAACGNDAASTGKPGADTAGTAAADTVAVDVAAGDSADTAAPVCPPPVTAAGRARARKLACADDLPLGRMASARVGDIVLENARARYVLRLGPHGVAMSGVTGGHIVDAVALGPDGKQRGVDALREWIPAVAFHLVRPDTVTIVDDGSAPGSPARVRVEGPLEPFKTVIAAIALDKPAATVVHDYVLAPDTARLELMTTVVPTTGAPELAMVADATFWSGAVDLYRPGKGDGFNDLPTPTKLHVIGIAPVDDDPLTVPAAIGFALPTSIVDAGGILAFVQGEMTVPAEGATFWRYLVVGGDGSGDLAAAMAAAGAPSEASLRTLQGKVTGMSAGVEVEALHANGAPLTRCRPDAAGAFACQVPAETARARALWLGNGNGQSGGAGQGSHVEGVAVQDQPDGSAQVQLQAPVPALVRVTAADAAGAAPLPFAVIAQPVGVAGADGRTFVDADGDGTFRLPPGTWKLWVHHGPEFSVHEAEVKAEAGATVTVAATLQRVLDTTGWIACDFHIHGEHSSDSTVANRQRVVDAAAAGVEYAVATDHDYITDYAPWVQEAGLAGKITVASGVEVSTIALGHHNVWPMTPQPDLAGQGAPDWFGKDPKALQELLRGQDAKRVVQVNHPRGSQSYFGAIQLGPTTDPALLAFDALELLNGKRMGDLPEVLADWFAMLARGLRATGTGTSDTHGLSSGVGTARTWVYVGRDGAGKGRDRQGVFGAAEADAALRAGRAVASAGPLLELTLEAGSDRADIGEGLQTQAKAMTVRARLQAPAWMPLGSVELYRDGELVHSLAVADAAVVGGRRDVIVTFAATPRPAGWWVALHRPAGKGSHPVVKEAPWAVTNPVWEGAVPQ